MKPEYDFSRAERGKFYRKGAEIRLPIYLDAKLQHRLEQIAEKRGKDLGEVVNQILEMSQEDNETEQYKIMNRLSRQEQIRIFRYLFPAAFVLALLLYGIFGSKVIWNAVLYLAIATFILRMIRMWLEFKVEKKDQEKKGM